MKWTLFIQQKIKIASLLFCVMFFIVLTSVLSSRNMDKITQSINSIYADRLVPATDVYYISDHLHTKKTLLENILLNPGNHPAAANELKALNKKINALVVRFEHTYLVNAESEFINEFKTSNRQYHHAELATLALIKSGNLQAAQQHFNTAIKVSHQQSIHTLGKLINVQSNVGKSLIENTRFNASTFDFLSALQIIVAVIIGVLIIKLVMDSRIGNTIHDKYYLN